MAKTTTATAKPKNQAEPKDSDEAKANEKVEGGVSEKDILERNLANAFYEYGQIKFQESNLRSQLEHINRVIAEYKHKINEMQQKLAEGNSEE